VIILIWILAGLALGVVVGYYIPFTYPIDYSLYMSVAILATMDSIFGAVKSGFESKYDNIIFLTGFIGNAILAMVLTYIGDRLGIPLYYVAILVFGSRIFDNLSTIRRNIVINMRNKKRGK
jgi:small basic protein